MVNEYLESLRAEYHEFLNTDPERARAAKGQIQKIVGPMTEEEERYYFEPAPVEEPEPAQSASESGE